MAFLTVRGIANHNTLMPSDYLIVDGVTAKSDGAYLIYPTPPSLAAKTRQQRQSGNVNLTMLSGQAFVRTEVTNFKYRYSKSPQANVTVSPSLGQTVSATTYNPDYTTASTGLNFPVGGVASLGFETIRPCIFMPNKASSPINLVASWEVGINEV